MFAGSLKGKPCTTMENFSSSATTATVSVHSEYPSPVHAASVAASQASAAFWQPPDVALVQLLHGTFSMVVVVSRARCAVSSKLVAPLVLENVVEYTVLPSVSVVARAVQVFFPAMEIDVPPGATPLASTSCSLDCCTMMKPLASLLGKILRPPDAPMNSAVTLPVEALSSPAAEAAEQMRASDARFM